MNGRVGGVGRDDRRACAQQLPSGKGEKLPKRQRHWRPPLQRLAPASYRWAKRPKSAVPRQAHLRRKLHLLELAKRSGPGAKTVYVVAVGSDEYGLQGSVVPIATQTGKAAKPIAVGVAPTGIVITPNGRTAYAFNGIDAATMPLTAPATVTPIDLVNHHAEPP